MSESDEPPGAAPLPIPAWRWPVLLIGSACLICMIASPFLFKGGPDAMQRLWLAAGGTSVLGSVTYLVGKFTFWSKYSGPELRFAFAPMILAAAILVGLVLLLVLAGILAS